MTKHEFLEKLRVALSGRVTADIVTDNLHFYEDYINTEVRKGKSEEQVLSALGDPRLIAKTIVETKGESSAEEAENNTARRNVWGMGEEGQEHFRKGIRVPAVLWLVIVILIVVLILSAVFSVITAILPVILPIFLVLLAVKVFRDWIH